MEKWNGIYNAHQGFWNLWHSHAASQLAHNWSPLGLYKGAANGSWAGSRAVELQQKEERLYKGRNQTPQKEKLAYFLILNI